LQVVQGSKQGSYNTTSSTFQDPGLSVSITPTLATSKVLVFANFSAAKGTTSTQSAVKARLVRDSTSIFDAGDRNGWNNSNSFNDVGTISICYLDSPSTTSAITYKIQVANYASGSSIEFNNYETSNTTTSTITVMEIGA
jgi:hypothetical protein